GPRAGRRSRRRSPGVPGRPSGFGAAGFRVRPVLRRRASWFLILVFWLALRARNSVAVAFAAPPPGTAVAQVPDHAVAPPAEGFEHGEADQGDDHHVADHAVNELGPMAEGVALGAAGRVRIESHVVRVGPRVAALAGLQPAFGAHRRGGVARGPDLMHGLEIVRRIGMAIEAVCGLPEAVLGELAVEALLVGFNRVGELGAERAAVALRLLQTALHELLVAVARRAERHDFRRGTAHFADAPARVV